MTVVKFLGRKSTYETLKHIGINLYDMASAMAIVAKYDSKKQQRQFKKMTPPQ